MEPMSVVRWRDAALGLVLAATLALAGCDDGGEVASEPEARPVRVVTAVEREPGELVVLSGIVEAKTEADLGFRIGGRVVELAYLGVSGDEDDLKATDEALLETFPDDHALARWIRMAQRRVAFQGLPARICWLGYGERARAGAVFNELVASGRVKAPIVIGRDHLDCGSVASPNRETEGMRDGSDAIADWPILNALVNTAAGAHWVSVHHGGGVGIGSSIHAGMVVVADGTADAAERLERVLTSDPGMGVVRHVDAGYERAIEVADDRGVRVPMREAE